MRVHSAAVGLDKPVRVIATGGGSTNRDILQVLADIFEAPVYISKTGAHSAAYGAALRAWHGYRCWATGTFVTVASLHRTQEDQRLELVAKPNAESAARMRPMVARYQQWERSVLQDQTE